MPVPQLDFWFDFSSPFAYLAATQVESVAARTGATLHWHPILLGALFREINQVDVPLFAMGPEKQAMVMKDLQRWAWWWGVPFCFPAQFPLRTVLPLRCVLASPQPAPLIRSLFRAAWGEGKDISQENILLECGLTPQQIASASSPNCLEREKLRVSTAQAREKGIFGVPTFEVNGRFRFWGQDRLSQVEHCLLGWEPPI